MTESEALERGRQSFASKSWSEACAHLTLAGREGRLAAEDLERLAIASHLIGRDDDSADFWARAHQDWLGRGDLEPAARCAFWLGFVLINRGEMARAGGWFARAQRLLDDGHRDSVERGYLLLPAALRTIEEGDPGSAYAMFEEAASTGERFHDPDLTTLGQLGRGQALIGLGKTAEGLALLDEAMVAVTADEVSPVVAGVVYCGVIDACQQAFDLRRAQEWTSALSHWCAGQPDLVSYQGQCLVHRATIMQLRGDWQDALQESRRAVERLSTPTAQPAVGAAFYQEAELRRLRGEFSKAAELYRQASRLGRSPEPGLALLRLAQGQVGAAASSIRRAFDEANDEIARSNLIPAYVEIMIAAGDADAAARAALELSQMAARRSAPLLEALSATAAGSVLLAQDDARAALATLRRAWKAWQGLDAPYEAARVRSLIGFACRALGDEDTAEMELDAARWVFEQLGAAPDLARLDSLSGRPSASTAGLTTRELEVLRLVAAGKSNRAIANELFISDKTVARHLSNIFAKLGLSSRSAATAYAYEHQLV
jgi:DNA-binding CsgD family transcriptional regulator